MTPAEKIEKLMKIMKNYPSHVHDNERVRIEITHNQHAVVWLKERYGKKPDAFSFDVFCDTDTPYKYQRQTVNIGTKKTPEQILKDFEKRVANSEATAANEELIIKERNYKVEQAAGLAQNRALFEAHGFTFSDRQKQETYKATINDWTDRKDNDNSIHYSIEAATDCHYNQLTLSGLNADEWNEIMTTLKAIISRHN